MRSSPPPASLPGGVVSYDSGTHVVVAGLLRRRGRAGCRKRQHPISERAKCRSALLEVPLRTSFGTDVLGNMFCAQVDRAPAGTAIR